MRLSVTVINNFDNVLRAFKSGGWHVSVQEIGKSVFIRKFIMKRAQDINFAKMICFCVLV